MKYAYEDMSEDQFERLVVCICHYLLGFGVQGFAKGRDGGRDAKFVGTAELFPSKTAPWAGTTIVQAKHTTGYNKSFSEGDFFNPDSSSSTISEELPGIKKLCAAKQLDHYMLFSNRRLTGDTESAIRTHIATECEIPEASIALFGIERIELLLKQFPQAAATADLNPIDSPLIVSPDDLAEVVQAFARQQEQIVGIFDTPPTDRILYEDKNALNNMTNEYAKEQRKRYLKDTGQIKAFLASPENYELLQQYESVVEEFQLKIIANRRDYQTFDKVMEYLAEHLFSRDPILRQHKHKRLTRVMLFYMYWNCDIGKTEANHA